MPAIAFTVAHLLSLLLAPAAPALNGPGAWPVGPDHQVVNGFDPPGTPWGAGHRGVDLLGEPGQPVRTAMAGTITFAGSLAGRGVVVVDHGAERTTYEPVIAAVAVGERVARGQRVGHLQLGMSHCFPQACLHWGLIRGRTYLNPLSLLGLGPVRLLPLNGAPPIPYPSAVRTVLKLWGVPAGRPSATGPW